MSSGRPSLPRRAAISRLGSVSLYRNSLYIVGSTISNGLLGYVFWIAVAQTHSEYSVGVASALISAMLLFSLMSQMGTTTGIIPQLTNAREPGDWFHVLNGALLLGCGAGLVAGAAGAGLLVLLFPELDVLSAAGGAGLFAAGVATWTACAIIDFAFLAERVAGNVLARTVIFNVLKIPLVLLPLVLGEGGALTIFAAWAVSSLVSVLFAIGFLLPRIRDDWSFSLRKSAARARAMVILFAGHHLTNIGSTAASLVLPLIVVARLSPAENGYFYVAWLLGGVFYLCTAAVGQSLLAEGSHEPTELASKVRQSALLLTALLAPVALLFLFGGSWVLGFFGGAYAREGDQLLLLLTAAALPTAITGIYGNVLRISDQLFLSSAFYAGQALMVLGGTWFLLPEVGIVAAGYSWLAAQTLGAVAAVLDLRRSIALTASRAGAPAIPMGEHA